MRASAVAEREGIASVSLVCSGFAGQASTTSTGLGFTTLAYAVLPGHVNMQSAEELAQNVVEVTAEQVIAGLTVEAETEEQDESEPRPRDIVFSGSFEEVNEFFYENEWHDRQPVAPLVLVEEVDVRDRGSQRRLVGRDGESGGGFRLR